VSPKKEEEPTELVGAESLGEEAKASVAASIERERQEDLPRRTAGMPAEADFVTPRENQGRR
jgi:hypothetical protein